MDVIAFLLYFIIFYFLVAIFTFYILVMLRQLPSSRKKKYLAWSIPLLLLLPLIPYLFIDLQTAVFGQNLKPVVDRTLQREDPGGKLLKYKLLQISPSSATVYVQEAVAIPCGKDSESALIFYFTNSNQVWKLKHWDTIWSDCGSADGITFPPYLPR